ncbi:MAG: hypothetical protein CMM46_10275 [Rhodospirillaceae bacterium]|nr:hypothetical protein [Rhodospirillaceae bacterium]|tara:strand:- start:313 stop:1527 length:1215 start_codon:yes stop_codon:yes gene_type:complete
MIQHYLRDQIDWEQPFTPEEYADRRRRTRDAMAAAGLDALYVTNPADLTWLTGYDMIWYHLENLTGLLVRTENDDTLFFDGKGHTTIISTTPEIREVCWLNHESVGSECGQIADALADYGLTNGKVGYQPWGYAPHGRTYDTMKAVLESRGATVEEHSFLVEELRFVKTPAEVAVVREAARIADEAMAAARDAITVGVMETELEAVIVSTMARAGGGYPGIRTMIGSGPRAGTHHSPPTHRRIRQGDLVFVDFCGVLHRYHVNINRTFSLGEPDQRWTDMMNISAGCIDAIVETCKVGDPLTKAQKVADDYTDSAGLRPYVWFVGGYSLGIAVPPDWCGSHWVSPRQNLGDRFLTPGQVFNMENQFDVWEDWPGGSGAAYIDSFLVTDSGLEVLSKLPRNIVVV